jgi:hypothetical protein
MLSYGEEYEYAHDRLAGSVVRKDGVPCLIQNVEGDGFTTYRNLGSAKWLEDQLENFNLEPIPLGFVNTFKQGLVYAYRLPARKFRQGLRADTFYYAGPPQFKIRYDSPDLINTALNIFPSVESCAENVIVEEYQYGCAFNRHWAIGKKKKGGMSLLFMTKPVGTIDFHHDGEKPQIKLENRFKYLEECLGEALNG